MSALSIKNLHKSYSNGFTALKGIDLEVEEGDFFALLGPNGAGKSTAIGIIASLINKSDGTVSVFGHDLDSDPEAVKSYIGLVPQEFNFNQYEPVEEILVNQAGYQGVPRREAFRRAEIYLKKTGLWDKRRVNARMLSGGMKRRMMIARALVHHPKLLILDEPTAGVDIENRHSMWDFLREINDNGTTIILTTHYLEEAESLCRKIAIINQGEIIENTTMSGLLNRLHCEVFLFDLKEPVSEVPNLGDYAVKLIDECTIEVEVSREQGINPLFTTLSNRGLEVVSMRNKQNRLEQLFVELIQQSGEA
ncbi:MAG: ABC transporter ATP-binding protein [Candidatus Polarisedimenticolaceae bacterium]|nr:ABC transporter ATP-binding protein [Candidatus Polarisedimenticolaceae bacterium]